MKERPINNPFAELNRFVLERGIALKKPETPQPQPPVPDLTDEESILASEMKNIKAFDQQSRNKRITGKHRASRRVVAGPENEEELFKNAIDRDDPSAARNMPEYMEGFIENINPLTMDKLRKSEFSRQRILDLHGYTVEDASELFRLFIGSAVRNGLNCVKVIHGRGLNSKGEAVLKESLKEWILRAMHRKWVVAFCSAIIHDGGPGATYILLKKRPAKGHIRIIG